MWNVRFAFAKRNTSTALRQIRRVPPKRNREYTEGQIRVNYKFSNWKWRKKVSRRHQKMWKMTTSHHHQPKRIQGLCKWAGKSSQNKNTFGINIDIIIRTTHRVSQSVRHTQTVELASCHIVHWHHAASNHTRTQITIDNKTIPHAAIYLLNLCPPILHTRAQATSIWFNGKWYRALSKCWTIHSKPHTHTHTRTTK